MNELTLLYYLLSAVSGIVLILIGVIWYGIVKDGDAHSDAISNLDEKFDAVLLSFAQQQILCSQRFAPAETTDELSKTSHKHDTNISGIGITLNNHDKRLDSHGVRIRKCETK